MVGGKRRIVIGQYHFRVVTKTIINIVKASADIVNRGFSIIALREHAVA